MRQRVFFRAGSIIKNCSLSCIHEVENERDSRDRSRRTASSLYSTYPGHWTLLYKGQGVLRLLCLSWLDCYNPFEEEDDALTNIGAVISNPLQLVSNPEPVGHTLENERVLLQCSRSIDTGEHSHQVMANEM